MGSGLLPLSAGAARLGRPLLPNVLSAQLAGGAVRARFAQGRRRDGRPALLTVHPAAPFEPRYAYARERARRVLPVAAPRAAPLADTWRIEPADARPRKLAAPERRSGRDRLLAATAIASRGGEVIQHGSRKTKRARCLLSAHSQPG